MGGRSGGGGLDYYLFTYSYRHNIYGPYTMHAARGSRGRYASDVASSARFVEESGTMTTSTGTNQQQQSFFLLSSFSGSLSLALNSFLPDRMRQVLVPVLLMMMMMVVVVVVVVVVAVAAACMELADTRSTTTIASSTVTVKCCAPYAHN